MTDPAPFILTLRMDDGSQERFDDLRRTLFPPERNHIPAHLTLFHHLPGADEPAVSATLEETCARHEPITLRVSGLRFLGRGVAYRLEAPRLQRVRDELADEWRSSLTAQDRQKFSPHVTVQNQVSSAEARTALERLQAEFVPFDVTGEGLVLWRYLGGPWRLRGEYRFRG